MIAVRGIPRERRVTDVQRKASIPQFSSRQLDSGQDEDVRY